MFRIRIEDEDGLVYLSDYQYSYSEADEMAGKYQRNKYYRVSIEPGF